MKKIVVVAGVTGLGKTKLGIELANKFNGEIISADSVAIYKELNIGSAKPTQEEQAQAVHHMVDVLDVNASYSVAEFQSDARQLIDDIIKRGKLPIVVGGTGLYINALIHDYEFEEEDTKHDNLFEDYSNEELYAMLLVKNEEAARLTHPNNRKRVIRALSRTQHNNKGQNPIYDALVFFIQSDRETIHNRINTRVDKMFKNGLLEEVKSLHQKYPDFFSFQSTQSIGYREFKDYLEGELKLEDLIELIKRNTRRFAKRQITWFKNKTNSIWIDAKEPSATIDIINKWIKN